jgi:hypothetical protein
MEPFKPKNPKPKPIMGPKPRMFTADNRCKIYEAMEKGLPRKIASQLAGVTDPTVNDWMMHGKRDQEDFELGHLDYQTEHAQFYSECHKCVAKFIQAQWENLAEAAKDPINWRANTFLLEKVDDELFGRRMKVNVDQKNETTYNVRIVSSAEWTGKPAIAPPPDPNTLDADFITDLPPDLNTPNDEDEDEDDSDFE